jgi:hypothetical protein
VLLLGARMLLRWPNQQPARPHAINRTPSSPLLTGVVSCYIMEHFAPGINFLLSAELDHAHKSYRFGFGFTAGE